MDFFSDDFGLDASPKPKPVRNQVRFSDKKSEAKSGKAVDQLDDLLDELMQKQKKRQSKQKEKQIQSSTSLANLQKPESPRKQPNFNATQKWQSSNTINMGFNQAVDLKKTYEPIRNRQNSKSFHEEKGSEDNKSFKSGYGPVNIGAASDLYGNDKNQGDNDFALPGGSMRNMMKPPLRKRAQSRADSEQGDQAYKNQEDLMPSIQNLDNINFMRPPLPKKEPSPPKIAQQISQPTVVQKQKIVYFKEDNTKLREQFEKQLKLIKQSHQKQISFLKSELDRQSLTARDMKVKLMKQFQQEREKQRRMYQGLAQKDQERTREMYQWQIKRKCESYQIEIDRLKKLNQLTLNTHMNNNSRNESPELQREQIRVLQNQLSIRQRKLQDKQSFLRQKQQILERRQTDFDMYRKRQEEKLQQEKRDLYNTENQLQKKRFQLKKRQQDQKLNAVNDISKHQLQIARQRQQIKVQQQELQIAKTLFEKQKQQYEQFNANIMKDYKRKLKQLQQEKCYYQEKEIELYKKIQTVEMMGNLKATQKRRTAAEQENEQNAHHEKPTGNKSSLKQKIRESTKPHQTDRLYDKKAFKSFIQPKEEPTKVSFVQNSSLQDYLAKVNRELHPRKHFLV